MVRFGAKRYRLAGRPRNPEATGMIESFKFCTSLPAFRQSRPGHVYLIYSESGHYKIGKTRLWNNRLSQLTLLLPFKIHLVHLIAARDVTCAERIIHERYKDRRTIGEWFKLSEDDVNEICSIEKM